jgi:hypothetical protein
MQKLTAKILEQMAGLPEGIPVSARELLHLGSRMAVDQALSRLVRRGQLLRACRGLYVRPIETRFGKRLPSVEHLLHDIAESKGDIIASHGAAAANALGLTTQVPLRVIYLTSGRSQRLTLGKQTVELRHAPKWQMLMPNRPAGDVIRALAWFGKLHAGKALHTLRQRLPASTFEEIAVVRPHLPTWLAEHVSRLVP